MRIYISGPMSGVEDFNYPAFRDAADWLRSEGHEPVSPAESDREHGLVPGTDMETFSVTDEARAAYLARDLPILLGCDGVLVLPGWEYSVGASVEVFVASSVRLPVYGRGPFGLQTEEIW